MMVLESDSCEELSTLVIGPTVCHLVSASIESPNGYLCQLTEHGYFREFSPEFAELLGGSAYLYRTNLRDLVCPKFQSAACLLLWKACKKLRDLQSFETSLHLSRVGGYGCIAMSTVVQTIREVDTEDVLGIRIVFKPTCDYSRS